MIHLDRWSNIAFAIQVMLKEEAFDLAKEFIDHIQKKEELKEANTEIKEADNQ